ncbi:MAG TPA: hypothetical protein VIA18_05905, partial [Polyangia bacterium]|nr:hypothetical protein [Polyangia bacterium]
RARSPELVRSAESALADLGAAFSPRVERLAAGVALDASELSRAFASDADAGNALVVAARKLGLAVRVGIARDKTTARIAARAGGESGVGDGARSDVAVVAPGREAAFLAPLPIALVEPEPAVLATLRGWGVRTIGELEALPQGGVAVGLGAEGARIARIARGQADAPLVVRPAPTLSPTIFEEGIDLDWPCANVEALLSVLRRLLENLTARLACRGVAAGDVGLTLKLAPRGRDVRVVPVPSPTRELEPLLALVRAALATSPPAHAVDSIRVRTTAARARPAQLSFAAPSFACRPSRDKLASTLPDAFAMLPSDAPRVHAPATRATRYATGAPDTKGATGATGAQSEKDGHEADDALPAQMTPAAADPRQLALHALRPPLDAEARLDRGRLRYLSGQGVGGQVLAAAGPFRMRDSGGQNATEDAAPPSIRDYYDVELSDGAIYRVFHDLQSDSWHIDGRYE